MILIVDDSEERRQFLQSKFPDDDVICVPSSKAAIEVIQIRVPALLILDGDLGPHDCGLKVIDFLIAHQIINTHIMIISMNPVKATQMKQALDRVQIPNLKIPYSEIKK